MSSTSRGGQRLADDYYETPAFATRAILPHLNWIGAHEVFDPCAGAGAILRAVESFTPIATRGIELESGRAEKCGCECGDALVMGWESPPVVVMNPPFVLAQEFVEKALAERPRGGEVAALLRLGMLAGQERKDFWTANPADVYVLSKRPNFTAQLRWTKAMGGGPCKRPVPHTKDGVCRRPSGHDGDCLTCSGDSADYCWAVWGPGRGGRWGRLDP